MAPNVHRESLSAGIQFPRWFLGIMTVGLFAIIALLAFMILRPEANTTTETAQTEASAEWFMTEVISNRPGGEPLNLGEIIAPGHTIKEFDPRFIDYLVHPLDRRQRQLQRGDNPSVGAYKERPIPASFQVDTKSEKLDLSTFNWSVLATYDGGKSASLVFKVAIVQIDGKNYLYPIKVAL